MSRKYRNPAKGKYCDKHKRWAINIGGKLRCKTCFELRTARRREREARA